MRLAVAAAFLVALAAPAFAAAPGQPVSLASLAAQMKLPFEQFALPNGLRVVVSTDRNAPIVSACVWYRVGSKDEAAGKTGFAHLFEHLMATGAGTENMPGDRARVALAEAGAVETIASTWFDRTNYCDTVPTAALPLSLFVRSEQMGHLLGAVTQTVLDQQRSVVKNEKRLNEGAPYGAALATELRALFPASHPYSHTVIGSMEDLDRASLEDVRAWFRERYGPGNAVLVLAGDIDVPAAKKLATQYFGDIPARPQPARVRAAVPTLPAPVAETVEDPLVSAPRLYRAWTVSGGGAPDYVLLDLAARILGGLSGARLETRLVKGDKVAVTQTARLLELELASIFEIVLTLPPGQDVARASQSLDRLVEAFVAKGPTEDEVRRAATQTVTEQILELDRVGGHGTRRGERGKQWMLGNGIIFADDPARTLKQVAAAARATPATVHAAVRRWLSRPVYKLDIVHGAAKKADTSATPDVKPVANEAEPAAPTPQRTPPSVGDIATVKYPKIERAMLANGMRIVYAQRPGLAVTRASFSFDAGLAADAACGNGVQAMVLKLLDQGTATLDAAAIAARKETLGARIATSASLDRSEIDVTAVSANLAPALDLVADMLRAPSFADFAQRRRLQEAAIQSEATTPTAIEDRMLPALLYGAAHAYGGPFSGTGYKSALARATTDDLRAFKAAWIRPDKATVYVVSDLSLRQVQAVLQARFEPWRENAAPGTKAARAPVADARPGIVLVDRPGAVQSVISAAELLPSNGSDDLDAFIVGNDLFAGYDVQSRLNLDIRQAKGWTYWVQSTLRRPVGRAAYSIDTSVQADRTGPALAAIRDDLQLLLAARPIDDRELRGAIAHAVNILPGSVERGEALLDTMKENDRLGRPDDDPLHRAARLQALATDRVNAALRANLDPARMTWLVVGDAARVRPQLETLGLPIRDMQVPAAEPPEVTK